VWTNNCIGIVHEISHTVLLFQLCTFATMVMRFNQHTWASCKSWQYRTCSIYSSS